MPVERHFVGAGRFGDRIHPNRPDSMPVKELGSGRKYTRTRRNPAVSVLSCSGWGVH
jgi:hypothetical protein